MPIYEFKCTRCGEITDELFRTYEEPYSVICSARVCRGRAIKIISAPTARLDRWQPQYKEDLAQFQKDPNAWCHTKNEYKDKCKKLADNKGVSVEFHTEC